MAIYIGQLDVVSEVMRGLEHLKSAFGANIISIAWSLGG